MAYLTRYQPYGEFTGLQNLSRLFQEFSRGTDELLTSGTFVPAVDIYEDEHSITLKVEVPGMDEKDIEAVAAKLKHGYLALARLEGALNLEQEGTEKIARFYGMAREQMLKAQALRDPAILRQLVGFVNDMREAWVEVQGREKSEQPGTLSQISNTAYAVTEIAAAAGWKA